MSLYSARRPRPARRMLESRLTVRPSPHPALSPKGRGDARERTEKRMNAVKRSAVSTGQLRRLPALHTRPIDLVVFQEPAPIKGRKPHLEGSFTLICLQRLSFPY